MIPPFEESLFGLLSSFFCFFNYFFIYFRSFFKYSFVIADWSRIAPLPGIAELLESADPGMPCALGPVCLISLESSSSPLEPNSSLSSSSCSCFELKLPSYGSAALSLLDRGAAPPFHALLMKENIIPLGSFLKSIWCLYYIYIFKLKFILININ